MRLFDAHCHLQDPRIAPHVEAVIARAKEAGVEGVHVNGTEEGDWGAVLGLRERWPGFVAVSLGVHPWRVGGVKGGWERRLREAVVREGCGIGEIGLDARMGDGLDAVRRRVFRAQLEMSYELEVPASLHCRGAWGEMLEILLKGPRHPAGLLIHAYSGPSEVLCALSRKNVFVSFGGSSVREGNKRAATAIRAAGKGQWMLETDSPDLAFVPKTLSEPSQLPLIAERVGKLRGIGAEEAGRRAAETARRLFGGILGRREGEKSGEEAKEA